MTTTNAGRQNKGPHATTEITPGPEKHASLRRLLEHKKAIDDAAGAVQLVIDQIARTKDELRRANAEVPDLDALLQQREDMLAASLQGHATQGELKDLETQIAGAKRETEVAQATLRGLERALQVAEERHAAVSGEHTSVLVSFLQGEAERAGAEYIAAAKTVRDGYLRLMALDGLLSAIDGTGSAIKLATWDDFLLPAFRLPGFEELTDSSMRGELFTDRGYRIVHLVEEAREGERERLRDLGAW
jgi:hypothetical protein